MSDPRQLKNVDLHPSPVIYALDALIVMLALIVIDLIIMSWMYVFS
jgi:hypothetical protein